MSKDSDKIFYELWFPKKTQHLTIIAAPSYDGLEDAKVTSPNYALLDNLGDRDSIYNIGKLLSRRYPTANIDLKCSESLSNGSLDLSDNLVIIGGPGGDYNNVEKELEGNEVCRLLSKDHIKSRINYSDDCNKMIVNGGYAPFQSEYNERSKLMTLDYGYFSAFKNPFYSKTRIIMLHGIHTLGVLGATRIFDGGEQDSVKNLFALKSYIDEHNIKEGYNFETFFKVKVTRGWITCPLLEIDNILFFNETSTTKITNEIESSIDDNNLRDTVINLIKIAKNNTTDSTRKKSHDELITKISSLDKDNIDILNKIHSICLKNRSIPENYIDEINTLLE